MTATQKKNAPGAEQSAEGNDPTPEGEIMNTVHPETDVHPEIQELLDAPGPIEVIAGRFYAEPLTERDVPVSDLAPVERDRIELGVSLHSFGRFYSLSGERIRGANVAGVPRAVMETPNAVHAMDGGIFVSEGIFVASEEIEIAGEPGIRMISVKENIRRARAAWEAEERAFIDANPAIRQAMPAWAESIDLHCDYPYADAVHMSYEAKRGRASVGIGATYADGRVTVDPGGPDFHLAHEGPGVAAARAAVADMQAVLDLVANPPRALQRRADAAAAHDASGLY